MIGKKTKIIADWIESLNYNDIPNKVINHTKMCILDSLGVGIYGSTLPWAKILIDVVEDMRGKKEATIWGTKIKAPAIEVAMVNSLSIKAFEMEQTNYHGLHPDLTAVPGTVAASEIRGDVGGKEFLAAMVAAYEVEQRADIASLDVKPPHDVRPCGLTPASSRAAIFGSVVGAGKILRLTSDELVHAFAIAINLACGVYSSTMVRRLSESRMAGNGVLAAILAKKGFRGITWSLDWRPPEERELGISFFETSVGEPNIAELTKNLGKEYITVDKERGVGFKMHTPTCRSNHSTNDSLKELLRKYPKEITPDTVEEVNILCDHRTYWYGLGFEPDTPDKAVMHLPYIVAVMLLKGEQIPSMYKEENLYDQEIHYLMKKVKVKIDQGIDALGPIKRFMAKIEIKTKDGKSYKTITEYPYGHTMNSATYEDLVSKFKRLTTVKGWNGEHLLTDTNAEKIIKIIDDLKNMDRMNSLIKLLIIDKP